VKVYQDYLKQITEYETHSYRVPLDTCPIDKYPNQYVVKFNGSTHPFLKGWIKSLTMDLNLIDPQRGDNICYDIVVGNAKIYRDYYRNSQQNLIPFDTIFPFGLLKYHKFELVFYFNQYVYDHRSSIDIKLTVVQSTNAPKIILL